MTDNEKAATFIGWKFCGSGDLEYESQRTAACRVCGARGPIGTLHRAPDMTIPNRYMKALEGLAHRIMRLWPALECAETLKFQCWIYDRWDEESEDCITLAHTYGESFGEAAIKALAALYDAENPTPDRIGDAGCQHRALK